MRSRISQCNAAPLATLAVDWFSTVSFSYLDSEPILSSDAQAQCVALANLCVDSPSSSIIRLFSSHYSSVNKRYPHLLRLFVCFSSSLLLRLKGESTHPVAIANMLEQCRLYVNGIVYDESQKQNSAFKRAGSAEDVEAAARWMLRGVPLGTEIASAVTKCLLLCIEGGVLYPNRIFVKSVHAKNISVFPGLLLDRSVTSLMRHSKVQLPSKVAAFTCGLEEDGVGALLGLVGRLGVGVVAFQRVVCANAQFLLAECGVLVIDRLSIHTIQPFAVVTGSTLLGSLEEASEASPRMLGTINAIGAVGHDTIAIQGPPGSARLYTLTVPLEGCRSFAKITQECIFMCAGMFSSPQCVAGNLIFERLVASGVKERAASEGWRDIVFPLVSAMSDAFGELELSDTSETHAIEPFDARHMVVDEALSLAAMVLRSQSQESVP